MTESAERSARAGWSVRSRILATILAVTALGLAVAGFAAYFVQHERTLAAIDDRLVARTDYAKATITAQASSRNPGDTEVATVGTRNFADTDDAMKSIISHDPSGRFESSVGIIDGEPTWVPGTPVDFSIIDHPALISRALSETADGRTKIGTYVGDGVWLRYIAMPVSVDPADPDDATQSGVYLAVVDVGASLGDLGSAFRTYAVIAAIALVAVGVVGWFVAGRLLRPIRRLRTTASRITASDLRERIPVTGTDDVSELTATVNDMLDRIDGAVTAQRRLLDDVRHELKTPITIVRGHLEVLDPDNVDDVRSTTALAIDELDRMARLVDDIESLAETELARERASTDVVDFTQDVFQKASVIPGHDWVLGSVAQATVTIDAGRITQAWLQLADNAAKYSPAGSRIELGSTATASHVEFWVRDRGPGIDAGSRERIFERFGRVDSGRGIRGSGLGLPIVRAIAQAHGGRVSLASSSVGSRFGIVIPTVDHTDTKELEVVAP